MMWQTPSVKPVNLVTISLVFITVRHTTVTLKMVENLTHIIYSSLQRLWGQKKNKQDLNANITHNINVM